MATQSSNRSAAARKAARTRNARSTKVQAKRTQANAKRTATSAKRTAQNASRVANAEKNQVVKVAEQAVDVPVGAALNLTDRVQELIEPWTGRTSAERKLRSYGTQLTRTVKRAERRGSTARRQSTRKVETTLRQNRRKAETTLRQNRRKAETTLRRNRREAEKQFRKVTRRAEQVQADVVQQVSALR